MANRIGIGRFPVALVRGPRNGVAEFLLYPRRPAGKGVGAEVVSSNHKRAFPRWRSYARGDAVTPQPLPLHASARSDASDGLLRAGGRVQGIG